MSNNNLPDLISQLTNAINQNTNAINNTPKPTMPTQKPQMNMAAIAELVQPSTCIAMDERSVIQFSSGDSMNNKNKKNSG
jgi:hypothetical protein